MLEEVGVGGSVAATEGWEVGELEVSTGSVSARTGLGDDDDDDGGGGDGNGNGDGDDGNGG